MFLYRLMFDLQANFNMVRCINMIYQTRLHIQSDCTVTSGKASHGGLLVGGYIYIYHHRLELAITTVRKKDWTQLVYHPRLLAT